MFLHTDPQRGESDPLVVMLKRQRMQNAIWLPKLSWQIATAQDKTESRYSSCKSTSVEICKKILNRFSLFLVF